MKKLLPYFIVLVLVLGLGVVHAQDKTPPLVAKRKFAHDAQIETVYDKTKDQTAVVMRWYRVDWPDPDKRHLNPLGLPYEKLDIQAAFGFGGRSLTATPESVQLEIRIQYLGGSKFKARDTPILMAIVDGESISLGSTLLIANKTWVEIDGGIQLSFERFSAHFKYIGLLRIATARKVSLKIGQVEFDLQERHLEALRDLASRMVP